MKRLVLLVVALAATPTLQAQPMALGLGIHAGTFGVGGDLAVSPVSHLEFRAGANFMPTKPSFTISDIKYTLGLPSPQFTAMADLFLVGGLRLTGGVRFTSSDLSATADLTGSSTTIDIGEDTYTGSQVGTIIGTIDTKSVSPYAGIGFGHIARRGIGFSLDLGVAFQGEPQVTLAADGPLNSDPTAGPAFRQNLADEATQFQDSVKLLKYYPVISIGLTIGF